MSIEVAWFLGAPIVGGAFVTAGIVVPRLKNHHLDVAATAREGVRVLPLRARAATLPVDTPVEVAAAAAVPVLEAAGEGALSTDEAGAESARTDHDATANAEVPQAPSDIARPAFGVRIATGLRSAFRRKRIVANVPVADDSRHDDEAIVDENTRTDDTNYGVVLSRFVPPTRVAPDLDAAAPVLETPQAAAPLVELEPESQPGPAENGIVDVDVPPGEDPIAWRANVAARERHLSELTANAQRLRDETAADEVRRQREAEAHDRQIELENIALAEEVRVRSEARARKWYARLDIDLEAPTVEVRMSMASSLAVVRAAWAGKLLREAFGQEDEARVRARLIGALVSGDHLDVTDPFYVAFDNGGIERAATFEMLMPRQHEAQWIVDLLAPLLVA
jgi:hypothetical protein